MYATVGLFCYDKFEGTPNEKGFNLSKLTKSYFSEGRMARRIKTIIGDFVKSGAPTTVSSIGAWNIYDTKIRNYFEGIIHK